MKKEIIIDGKGSDWFEKATFVLKGNDTSNLPKDLFSYAEEIVEKHLKKMPQASSHYQMQKSYPEMASSKSIQNEYSKIRTQKEKIKKREKQVNTFLFISLLACALSLIALTMSIFS